MRTGGDNQRMTMSTVWGYTEFVIPIGYEKLKLTREVKAKDKTQALIIVPLRDKTIVMGFLSKVCTERNGDLGRDRILGFTNEYTEKGRVHKDQKGMVQKAGGLPGQVGVRKERPEGFRMGCKIKAEKASLGVAI